MIGEIKNLADVETFARQLVAEGLIGGLHPDDPFGDYVDEAGNPLYSPDEAAVRNRLMDQCFCVCGDDIYEIVGRITLKGTPFESIFDEDHEKKYAAFMKKAETGKRNQESDTTDRVVFTTL